MSGRRPLRVLLCPDKPDWAFHNIARNIERYAPAEFEIELYFTGEPSGRDLSDLFQEIVSVNADIVHAFWREDLFNLFKPEALNSISRQLKIDYADAIELISGKCFTTSVYDHLHTSEKSLRERAIYFDIIDGYTVSSNILYDFYASRPELPKPDAIITDGVDLQKFLPASGDKCRGPLSELVVGWVGNSAWGKSQGGDPKGYHRLFRPAIEILERRGVPVKVRLADAQAERIAFEQMPSFYRSIHVLACTSAAEGTPNPVLEAMACGVAVVSTDVGIVRDAFGPLQAQYILNDMTPDTLADALQRLSSDVDRYESLCAENVAAAAGWSWEEAVKGWWPFWIDAQRRSSDHRLSTRRREALIQACGSLNAYVQGIPRRRPRTRSWIEMITGRPAVRRRQS